MLLPPGRTAVVVHALDVAGGQASAGVMVTRTGTPTTLRITPDQRTLLVGQVSGLQATNAFTAAAAEAVTWTSSDTDVVTIDAEAGTLTAVGAGTATLAATVGTRSAEATVTVVAATDLAMGTTLWQLDALSGGTVSDWLPLQRVAPEVPDLVVQTDGGSGGRTMRFVHADGTVLAEVPSLATVVMADVGGGVIVEEPQGDEDGYVRTTLARWPTVPGEAPWRHTAVVDPARLAQAPDGTLWYLEGTVPGAGTAGRALVGLDGQTGTVRRRVPLPASRTIRHAVEGCEGLARYVVDGSGDTPIVDAHGRVRLLVHAHEEESWFRAPCVPDDPHGARRVVRHTLSVLSVAPDGPPTWTHVRTSAATWQRDGITFQFQTSGEETGGGTVLPDSAGGVVVTFSVRDAGDDEWQLQRTYVDAAGVRGDVVPTEVTPTWAGEDGVVYAADGLSVTAFDAATAIPQWTRAATAALAAGAYGSVVVRDEQGDAVVNSAGVEVERTALPERAVYRANGTWIGGDGASVSVSQGTALGPPLYAYQAAGGSRHRTAAPEMTRFFTLAPVEDLRRRPEDDPATVESYLSSELEDDVPAALGMTRVGGTRVGRGVAADVWSADKAKLHAFHTAAGAYLQSHEVSLERAIGNGIHAVAFLGHSVESDALSGVMEAVGLMFYDMDLIKGPLPVSGVVNTRRGGNYDYQSQFAVWGPKIYTDARLLFLGVCKPGAELLSFIEGPRTGPGPVIVVNENAEDTSLWMAWLGWRTMLASIAQAHRSIADAVADANAYLAGIYAECLALPPDPNTGLRPPCAPLRLRSVGGNPNEILVKAPQ